MASCQVHHWHSVRMDLGGMSSIWTLVAVSAGVTALTCLVLLSYRRWSASEKRNHLSTVIVLGSGGHTTEMLVLLSALDKTKFRPRTYIAADTDLLSVSKAKALEDETALRTGDATFLTIPRAREVGQSWLSSLWTAAKSSWASWIILKRVDPCVVLCNGPGTCVPICALARMRSLLTCKAVKIVFVESVCRLKTLSLSAKILLAFADEVVVQWPELALKHPATKYVARFV